MDKYLPNIRLSDIGLGLVVMAGTVAMAIASARRQRKLRDQDAVQPRPSGISLEALRERYFRKWGTHSE